MRRYGRKISFNNKSKYDGLRGPYTLANNLLRRYLNFCEGIWASLVDSFLVVLGQVLICFEGCSEDIMYLFFSFFLDTLFLYIRSCDHFYIYIVLILFICGCMFLSPTLTCGFSFLSLCTCFFLRVRTQRCLDEFCFKCFRNISCQSLLAINFLLAKSFKSLC